MSPTQKKNCLKGYIDLTVTIFSSLVNERDPNFVGKFLSGELCPPAEKSSKFLIVFDSSGKDEKSFWLRSLKNH